LCGQQFAALQPHLDMDMRRAPAVRRRTQRSKI
jgi:hypothetical protein